MARTCECGCGLPVKEGQRFIRFHHLKTERIRKLSSDRCKIKNPISNPEARAKQKESNQRPELRKYRAELTKSRWERGDFDKIFKRHPPKTIRTPAEVIKSKSDKMKAWHSGHPEKSRFMVESMAAAYDGKKQSERMKIANPLYDPETKRKHRKATHAFNQVRWSKPPKPSKIQHDAKALIDFVFNIKSQEEVRVGPYWIDIVPLPHLAVEINGSGHYAFYTQKGWPVEKIWGRDVIRSLDLTRKGWTILPVEHDDYANDMKEAIRIIQEEM